MGERDKIHNIFKEYCSQGYEGGEKGLRCYICDRKYSGEAKIYQLCPVCAAYKLIQEISEDILENKGECYCDNGICDGSCQQIWNEISQKLKDNWGIEIE
jgi:hypothetical protein